MSTPASKLPLGLLDLLGIKAQGEYPRFLSPTIAPTFTDLPQLLYANHHEFGQTSGQPAPVLGQNVFVGLTVPQTEIWAISGFTVRVDTGVGDTVTLQPIVIQHPLIDFNITFASVQTVPANVIRLIPAVTMINDVAYLQPGAALGFWVEALTVTNFVLVNARFRRTRLRI